MGATMRIQERARNQPRSVVFTTEWGSSGIDISYTASRREITVGGWYDQMVGIEPVTVPLADFLAALGIEAR